MVLREIRDSPDQGTPTRTDSTESTTMVAGAPGSAGSSGPATLSASALLKEIGTLRGRLKEIEEDDTRSSVVSYGGQQEGELINMMRKDLAKVENEKADQELHFMNQISTLAAQHKKAQDELREKLQRSEQFNEQLSQQLHSAEQKDQIKLLRKQLDEERTIHGKEIDIMKQNLASTDMEMVESRREMDHLHEEVMILQEQREELLTEVDVLKLEFEDEQSKADSYSTKLRDANHTINRLNEQVSEQDVLLQQQADEMRELRDSAMSANDDAQLELAVTHLEERLRKFQTKLSEKDRRIENLSKTLAEERQKRQQQPKPSASAIDFLRKQNKILNDEVRVLRRNGERPGGNNEVFFPSGSSPSVTPRASPKPVITTAMSGGGGHNRKGVSSSVGGLGSPKTPVSDIVASFERRKTTTTNQSGGTGDTDAAALSAALDDERKIVNELRDKLVLERKTVEQLRLELECSPAPGTTTNDSRRLEQQVQTLKSQLSECHAQQLMDERERADREKTIQQLLAQVAVYEKNLASHEAEVERLRSQLADYEVAQSSPKNASNAPSDDVEKLRLKVSDLEFALSTSDKERRDLENELTRLRATLSSMEEAQIHSTDEHKERERTIERLQAQVRGYEESRANADEERKNREKMIERLRSQIHVLEESQTESVMDIETLQTELKKKDAASVGHPMTDDYSKTVDELETKLRESEHDVERLRVKVSDYELVQSELEENLREGKRDMEETKSKCDNLEKAKASLETAVDESEKQIEELKSQLTKQQTNNNMWQGEEKKDDGTEEELSRLRTQVSALLPELQQAMAKIASYQAEIAQLKQDLEKERQGKESKPVTNRTQRDYDAEINKLKVELTKTQISKADIETELNAKVKELLAELESLEDEAEGELEKMGKLCEEKEKENKRLQQERVQICSSINGIASSRKEETEELQAELLDMTAKTTAQSREIQSLKSEIETCENRLIDAEKLHNLRIKQLEGKLAVASSAKASMNELERLRGENQKLRESVRAAKLERRSLQERLDSRDPDKTTSKSAKVLQDRNNALRGEVDKLTRRLKKMEDSITRVAI